MTTVAKKIECPKCGLDIKTTAPLEIYGQAQVSGIASIKQFFDKGIEWETHDSEYETFDCPKCGAPIKLDDVVTKLFTEGRHI